MLELHDRQQRLTGNQRRIVFAAVLGDMLEFFDYYLIGFVLAFIVGPWTAVLPHPESTPQRPHWLAEDAVTSDRSPGQNSLLAGKITGNFAVLGPFP